MPDITPEMLELDATLKIKDEEKKLPLKDVIAKAQKAEYADKTLREAHEMKRQLEEDRKLDDTLRTIGQNLKEGLTEKNQEKLRASLLSAGLSKEEADAMLGAGDPKQSSKPPKEDDDEESDEVNPLVQQVQELTKTVEFLIEERNKDSDTKRKMSHKQVIDKAIDADPYMRKMLQKHGEDEEMSSFLRNTVYARVAKASEKVTFGPRAIQSGLGEAKKVISNLSGTKEGGAEGEDEETEWDDDSVPSGLGPSGHPVSTLHRKREPIKPLSPMDKGYEGNLFERLKAGLRNHRSRR